MHGRIAREEKCMGNNTLKRKNARENRHLIGEMHRKITIPRGNCAEKNSSNVRKCEGNISGKLHEKFRGKMFFQRNVLKKGLLRA
jgi:hypothetical protein